MDRLAISADIYQSADILQKGHCKFVPQKRSRPASANFVNRQTEQHCEAHHNDAFNHEPAALRRSFSGRVAPKQFKVQQTRSEFIYRPEDVSKIQVSFNLQRT